jgi:hypothetical protein
MLDNILALASIILINNIGKPILDGLVWLLVHTFFVKYTIISKSEVKKVDNFLVKNGYCTCYVYDYALKSPGIGIHFAYLGYPMFFVLSTPTEGHREYDIYANEWSITNLKKATILKAKGVRVAKMLSLSPHSYTTSLNYYRLKGIPNRDQQKFIKQVYELYLTKKNVMAIISGEPGTGKSESAIFLADYIKKYMGCITYVVSGFDPTAKGLYADFYENYLVGGPVIITMDEYDVIVEKVKENQESSSESSCIAQNKGRFLGFIDDLNRIKKLIIIATTNKPFNEIDYVYIRPGRFDIRETFTEVIQ